MPSTSHRCHPHHIDAMRRLSAPAVGRYKLLAADMKAPSCKLSASCSHASSWSLTCQKRCVCVCCVTLTCKKGDRCVFAVPETCRIHQELCQNGQTLHHRDTLHRTVSDNGAHGALHRLTGYENNGWTSHSAKPLLESPDWRTGHHGQRGLLTAPGC